MDNINNKSVQEKEELIVGTIIEANKQLQTFLNESKSFKKNKFVKLYESKYADVIDYNMKSLFADVTNTNIFNLNENNNFPSAFENKRKNYYSYFNKVYKFLNGYELNIQTSLNESLKTDVNSTAIDIKTFKNFLKNTIKSLEKQNDYQNYDTDILNIKTFAKQPIFVYGYDICNNIKNLSNEINLNINNLIGIVYSEKDKQIWFVPKNSQSLIIYDIINDELKTENNFIKSNLDPKKYLEQLKTEKDIYNLFEIYTNQDLFDLKFTDNLYHDYARMEMNNKMSASKLVR